MSLKQKNIEERSVITILLPANGFWNNLEQKIVSIPQEVIDILKYEGYKLKKLCKGMEVNGKNYELISYVARQEDKLTIRAMLDIASPHRPYPTFVYILSIVLYELMPKKSQRLAAEITRKVFDLVSYSASTLCRVRKKLKCKTSMMMATLTAIGKDVSGDANASVVDQVVGAANCAPIYPEAYNADTFAADQEGDNAGAPFSHLAACDANNSSVGSAGESANLSEAGFDSADANVSSLTDDNASLPAVDLEGNGPPKAGSIECASKQGKGAREKNEAHRSGLVDVCREFQARTEICVGSIIKKGRAPPHIADDFAACVGRFCRKYFSMHRELLI